MGSWLINLASLTLELDGEKRDHFLMFIVHLFQDISSSDHFTLSSNTSLQSRIQLCDPMDCSLLSNLSMGFSRQEYWSGLPFPPPGDLPDPGIEPKSLISPALGGRFFTTSTTWEAHVAPSHFVYLPGYYIRLLAVFPKPNV